MPKPTLVFAALLIALIAGSSFFTVAQAEDPATGEARLAVIVLMFAVYAAGVSGGREQTVLDAQGTPICQQVLKP